MSGYIIFNLNNQRMFAGNSYTIPNISKMFTSPKQVVLNNLIVGQSRIASCVATSFFDETTQQNTLSFEANGVLYQLRQTNGDTVKLFSGG